MKKQGNQTHADKDVESSQQLDKQPHTGTKVQGEGDYEAARRYNRETTEHAQGGQAPQAARDAEPKSRSEARELERAEKEGRSRAKDEDPLLDEPERISRDGMTTDDSNR